MTTLYFIHGDPLNLGMIKQLISMENESTLEELAGRYTLVAMADKDDTNICFIHDIMERDILEINDGQLAAEYKILAFDHPERLELFIHKHDDIIREKLRKIIDFAVDQSDDKIVKIELSQTYLSSIPEIIMEVINDNFIIQTENVINATFQFVITRKKES